MSSIHLKLLFRRVNESIFLHALDAFNALHLLQPEIAHLRHLQREPLDHFAVPVRDASSTGFQEGQRIVDFGGGRVGREGNDVFAQRGVCEQNATRLAYQCLQISPRKCKRAESGSRWPH
jgi:hypothetical protein